VQSHIQTPHASNLPKISQSESENQANCEKACQQAISQRDQPANRVKPIQLIFAWFYRADP
jgi:hypothetical protein